MATTFKKSVTFTANAVPSGTLETPGGDVFFVATVSGTLLPNIPGKFRTAEFEQTLQDLEVTVNAGFYNLIIEQGAYNSELITWLDEDGNPHDLTAWAAKMSVRVLQRDNEVVLTVTSPGTGITSVVPYSCIDINEAAGQIELKLLEAETTPLDFDAGVYDLLLYPPATGDNLHEAGIDFTYAIVDASNDDGRAEINIVGGDFSSTLLAGDAILIYGTENSGINDGVYTVVSQSSNQLVLSTPMRADNSQDTTIKMQYLNKNEAVRLVEGNCYLHRRVTEA